jgi:hypothetical protein
MNSQSSSAINDAKSFRNALSPGKTLSLFYQDGTRHNGDITQEALDKGLFFSPVNADDDVEILCKVVETADENTLAALPVTATAAVRKNNLLIACHVLRVYAKKDSVADLMGAKSLNMFHVDELIPLPGGRGYEFAGGNPDAATDVEELRAAYGTDFLEPEAVEESVTDTDPQVADAESPIKSIFAVGEYFGDALVEGRPYDEGDNHGEISFAIGANAWANSWPQFTSQLGSFKAALCKHKEKKKKDAEAFVLSKLAGDKRKKLAVQDICGAAYDFDTGIPYNELKDVLIAAGYDAVVYSTFSAFKIRSLYKKDDILDYPARQILLVRAQAGWSPHSHSR